MMKFRRIRPRKRPIPGSMGKLEEEYAKLLELRKMAGEILGYRFRGNQAKARAEYVLHS